MAIRAPDGAKNSHILPTGQWYAPSAVNYSALACNILHYLALFYIILHYLALSAIYQTLPFCSFFQKVPFDMDFI